MKFNAHTDKSAAGKETFITWLLNETVSALQRAAGKPEALKAAVFLYLNRAYEAGLSADEITDLFGVQPGNALTCANLGKQDEELVLVAFESMDGLIEAVHGQPPAN
jgi:hypothetical protein